MEVLLARLLDPVLLVPSLVLGALSPSWWHLFAAAIAAAAVQEMSLFAIQETRVFNPVSFGLAVLAAALWASMAFGIKRYLSPGR